MALRSSAILDSGPRLLGLRPSSAASRFDASSVHRLVASTWAWDEGVMPPTVPASSSHRGRSTPRAVPEASREWIVTPPAGAAPTPTNGTPPDGCPSGMRWGTVGRERSDGDYFLTSSAVMVGLVPTIHVCTRERLIQPFEIGLRQPSAPQDVDGRHKGDHDDNYA